MTMGDKENKDLRWGETPWDHLSREDLLREVQRMASALVSVRGVLQSVRLSHESNPFWRPGGRGNSVLARADQALVRYDAAGSEQCYRAFFRYANSLLFETVPNDRWWVCDHCRTMRSPSRPDPDDAPACQCREGQVMRPIAWKDLRPAGQSTDGGAAGTEPDQGKE